MLVHTAVIGCTKKPRLTQLRICVVAGLMLAACSLSAWAEPLQDRYLQSRFISSDASGAMLIQTHRGDSLRVVAQHYSRVNNIPFARAFEILQKANEHQFPDGNADKMLLGTQLLLPNKDANPSSAETVVAPSTSASETTSATTGIANDKSAATQPEMQTTLNVESAANQSSNSLAAQLNKLEDKLQAQVKGTAVEPYYAKLKAWFLKVPLSLWAVIIPTLLLVLWVARLTRGSNKPQTSSEPKNDAAVHMPLSESLSVEPVKQFETKHDLEQDTAAVKTAVIPDSAIAGWMNHAPVAEPIAEPIAEPVLKDTIRTVQIQTHATTLSAQTTHSSVSQNEVASAAVVHAEGVIAATPPLPTPLETLIESKPNTNVAQDFDKLKQVLNGLTADQLDLRKNPANESTPAKPVGSVKTADMNGLLQQYAERSMVKSAEHNIHYGSLKERTRLQKWMSVLDVDQLLTHAQAAYQSGQGSVAQHILNEVLLRGNAAQCSKALDLRNGWLTPTQIKPANETN
jgi:hypothetical protein